MGFHLISKNILLPVEPWGNENVIGIRSFNTTSSGASIEELKELYVRNTPGSICQYKEDGLVSRPPSLLTSMR